MNMNAIRINNFDPRGANNATHPVAGTSTPAAGFFFAFSPLTARRAFHGSTGFSSAATKPAIAGNVGEMAAISTRHVGASPTSRVLESEVTYVTPQHLATSQQVLTAGGKPPADEVQHEDQLTPQSSAELSVLNNLGAAEPLSTCAVVPDGTLSRAAIGSPVATLFSAIEFLWATTAAFCIINSVRWGVVIFWNIWEAAR